MADSPMETMHRAAAALRVDGLPMHHREQLAADMEAASVKAKALSDAVCLHLSRLSMDDLDAIQRKLHEAHREFDAVSFAAEVVHCAEQDAEK